MDYKPKTLEESLVEEWRLQAQLLLQKKQVYRDNPAYARYVKQYITDQSQNYNIEIKQDLIENAARRII